MKRNGLGFDILGTVTVVCSCGTRLDVVNLVASMFDTTMGGALPANEKALA